MQIGEKGLPINLEAERLVLGEIMLDESHWYAAADGLELDDFGIEKHRRIWRRMIDIRGRGEHVDRITVAEELMKAGELDSCGGLEYLMDLDSTIPQMPSIESYVRIVREKSLLRRIMAATQHAMNRALLAEEAAQEILSGTMDSLRKLMDGIPTANQPVSTRDLIERDGIDALLAPRVQGDIRLPWSGLNKALGGISGGQVIVLLGETSRGKTSFALQAAVDVSKQHRATVVWTMEMAPRSMFQRLVTQISGVYPRLNASFEERDRQRMAVALLGEDPIYFDNASRNVAGFCANLRRIQGRTRIGLVIVDYLQLIRSASRESRAQQVSENSRNLKLAAMDFNLPFLVLSQVDRSSVKGKDSRIGLHSAKESGDIENDADVMLWIEAGELSRDQPTSVAIVVGKQREGPAGFSIPMMFQPRSQTFHEIEGE